MSRFLLIVALFGLLFVTGGGIMMYLAYGLADRPSEAPGVPGLSDSVTVELFKDASARIQAADEADAYAALGYLHAQEHGWAMALYQRTAIGRLSGWFGDELLELDRLALRLGLARGAREGYAVLPDEQKRILSAYARGVNASWDRHRAGMREEFVLLGVEPDHWEPWHALAVERLYAWMAAPRPSADTLASAGGEAAAFFDADRLLQRLLHLHGFENSLAWTLRDSTGVRLFQRHVYGASALPFFQSAVLEWPGAGPVSGATLIGTPFMPIGKDDARTWSILLSSSLTLERAVRDTAEVTPVFERLISADGEEHLLRIERTGQEIFFEAQRPFFVPTDSTAAGTRHGWVLRWSGFIAPSDAGGWAALARGDAADFQLYEGDGLILGQDGGTSIIGQPLVTGDFNGGSLISNSTWAAHAVTRLDTLLNPDREQLNSAELRNDRVSSWAADLAPRMTKNAIAVPNQPALVTEALAFLRNWDFAYDRPSIAASIFDSWVKAYKDSLGHLPTPTVPDSSLNEMLVRYELLVKAVERLAGQYGDNLSQWRWEEFQPKQFYFPVFSADTLLTVDVGPVPKTRYAPISIPGAGHPSALFWGPSMVQSDLPSPAGWEAWVSTGTWDQMLVRTRRFQASRFFGRYLVSDRPPEASVIAGRDGLDRTILLLP